MKVEACFMLVLRRFFLVNIFVNKVKNVCKKIAAIFSHNSAVF